MSFRSLAAIVRSRQSRLDDDGHVSTSRRCLAHPSSPDADRSCESVVCIAEVRSNAHQRYTQTDPSRVRVLSASLVEDALVL